MAFLGRLKSLCPCVRGVGLHSIIVSFIKKNQIRELESSKRASVPFPTVFFILLMTSAFKIGYIVIIICFYCSFCFPWRSCFYTFSSIWTDYYRQLQKQIVIIKINNSEKWEDLWNAELCVTHLKGHWQSRECPEESDQSGEGSRVIWGTRESGKIISEEAKTQGSLGCHPQRSESCYVGGEMVSWWRNII